MSESEGQPTARQMREDLSRVLGGAAAMVGEMRNQVRGRLRGRLGRLAEAVDAARAEDVDLLRDMLAAARDDQARFDDRLGRLEARLEHIERTLAGAGIEPPPTPKRRPPKAAKPARTARGRSADKPRAAGRATSPRKPD